ncbi:MAG TPA: hypothetical protein VE987_18375 [Polyangiaceae bacterium]|nr:hypothetical protein [Polyangiaceae bacterium]
MALALVDSLHVRVYCDGCRSATAEVCSQRDLPVMARVAAIRKFRAAGWHHDPGYHSRSKTLEQVQRDGSGRWYCPQCASKSHL